ncbi:acyclic terpene utilization AtuA family protein [Desulforamulus aquiferis]|uniref:Acyclic terpene utilization AtuA family protein n=1 Tax=Desulforamulus aquiferis TaxID=1397668 RepID=A0AAW7ZDG1_9FIRM|nr:acyclic terpene utilization AtuA family protein [Desulforamulus aquiferis]MDO7787407.1 acyclic terpene utilization AtuA family protein [Desulforamulus aquiferis]
MKEYRVLSPTAILGYGFPEQSFIKGLEKNPHLIAVDAGSTDPGPYYLGAGVSFTDRMAVKRDLELIISAGLQKEIPVVIGTAGGCGAKAHLDWNLEIIKELAEEKDWAFPIAVINSEIDKDKVIEAFNNCKISPLYPVPELNLHEIQVAERIVGQMGVEPVIEALNKGAKVVLAGRAYDPAVFSASAINAGFDKGLAIHMGKILECGAIAATPGSGSDCLLGTLRSDCFIVEPLTTERKCTPTSVAAHTLYEKTNPYLLPGPGGVLDLRETSFTEETERSVKVAGSRYIANEKYTIKLEGAKKVGYRTVSIAGCRDPIMISKMEHIIEAVRGRVQDNFSKYNYEYYLNFNIYGKNGVMAQLEPEKVINSHELGIIIEAVGETQEIANTICSFARSTMLHYGYPGRVATAGNLAFPYSPSDFKGGAVYNFNIYHLMEVENPLSLFPIDIINFGEGK